MIVLIVSPEEAAQIRDGLPAGALRDHVAGAVRGQLIPAPIPELVICRPIVQVSEEIFDARVADQAYRAAIAVLDGRRPDRRIAGRRRSA